MMDRPWLALIPAVLLFLAGWLGPSRAPYVAGAAWVIYCLYELGIKHRLLCGEECNIRVDLVFLAPLLALGTVGAIGRVVWRLVR